MSQWDQNGGVFYFDAKSAKTGKKAYFDQQTSCTLPLGRSKFATNLFVFEFEFESFINVLLILHVKRRPIKHWFLMRILARALRPMF